jgi:hypothetical protein
VSCTELHALIEPIAAGEVEPDAGARAHLATCIACARALALARQIDVLLAAQPAPDTSPNFTPTLMARLRRDRWRSEQYLDVAFNVAVALAIVAGVGGLWLVLSATGLVGVGTDLTRLLMATTASLVASVAPALPIYTLAAGVFVSGVAIWWWAEHGLEI